MDVIADQAVSGNWSTSAAWIALAATAVSCAALVLLHVVSPEFQPSWRAVSEYANGRAPWLLTVVFLAWAVGSFALLVAVWPLSATVLGKAALAFLILAGIGQAMGGAFDINHKLHGLAAMIGIPSLCIAAVLVTLAMGGRSDIAAPPIWSAHLPWISFALMIAAMMMFFGALKAAGVVMSPDSAPLTVLPEGVTSYLGWANRLLFAASYLWVVLTSLAVIKA